MFDPNKNWTPEAIRRGVLFRRYQYDKPATQIADETGLPPSRITDVIAGRPFSKAVAATLIGYLTTPAGTQALKANYHRHRTKDSIRHRIIDKIIMLHAVGKRYGIGPKLGEAQARNNGELMCYAYSVEDKIKRRVLDCYPAAKKRKRLFDGAPLWKWVEYLERSGGTRIDPPRRSGLPKGCSPRAVPSSLRRGGFSPPAGKRDSP